MYLHLGDEFIIPFHTIIGIFDMDAVTVTKTGQKFLQNAEKNGRLYTISENLPKSFIVCRENGQETVYLSQISATTLNRRMERGIDSDSILDTEGISWTSRTTHSI